MKITGVNPYILVNAERAAQVKSGWRKPMPVIARINGKPKKGWRINMMPKGNGSFYLYLHGGVRKASGTMVGDTVEVEIRFDAAYRNGPIHPLPAKFQGELNKNPNAKKAWDMLSPSRQKEILRYFANLKSEEALLRNISRAMRVLSGDKDRFMARSWKDGS